MGSPRVAVAKLVSRALQLRPSKQMVTSERQVADVDDSRRKLIIVVAVIAAVAAGSWRQYLSLVGVVVVGLGSLIVFWLGYGCGRF